METKIENPYAVKNVKSFMGREGGGYECSLYKNGKRIGTVTDTAGGGMVDFYLNKGEKEILDAHCLTLPKWGSEFGDGKNEYDTDCDIFLSQLVRKFDEQKQYKKWCKKQTVFSIDGDKDGHFRTINKVFDANVKAHLVKKYPDCGLRIINEEI